MIQPLSSAENQTSATPSIVIAAAVNNPAVLAACLGLSPDIVSGDVQLKTYQGFPSAAAALNQALNEATADYVVLVHQDVYLPQGFIARLRRQLTGLLERDPTWAVAGVIGLDDSGQVHGETWSSGLQKLVGRRTTTPEAVVTLDEVLLVVRRAAGVMFDPAMPGFHLYAADLVLNASRMDFRSYVVPLPIVHHSRPVVSLDAGYRRAYRFMQKKWRTELPVPNLVCTLQQSIVPLLVRDAKLRWRNRGRTRRMDPPDDPVTIARRLGMEGAAPGAEEQSS